MTFRRRDTDDEIEAGRRDGLLARREVLSRLILSGLMVGAVEAMAPAPRASAPKVHRRGLDVQFADKEQQLINFEDYGACDGFTDDSAAFAAALSQLDETGGVLQLPAKTIAMTLNSWPTFSVPGNVRISGTAGATTVVLTSDDNAQRRMFATTAGDNVTFEGVRFVRGADFQFVFFYPGGFDGFHIKNCVLDGQRDVLSAQPAHGIDLDAPGTKSNITIRDSTVTRLDYGLLQNNAITSTCDTIVVDHCTFRGNFRDDLCFNAPNADMKNVSVSSSRFFDNASPVSNAGFGVDLAHVTEATVHDCHFENYGHEAIHVEDYSAGIVITENQLVACGRTDTGGILVMSGCSNLTISGNTVDSRSNKNSVPGILALAAGSGTTPGGRPMIAPSRITLSDNTIYCGAHSKGIYAENVPDIAVTGNRIFGEGKVAAGVWDDANPGPAITVSGQQTVVDTNTIAGFRYGICGPVNKANAVGNPGSITRNAISDCYLGILAVTDGALNVNSNTISNCVRPMVAGGGGRTAQPSSVIGNHAIDCVHGFETDGKLLVIRPGSFPADVGSDRTIDVTDTFAKLPVGTVINFAGGGTLTLTAAVSVVQPVGAYPYLLTGDISGATVTADDVGAVIDLPHSSSSTSADNQVVVTQIK